ncbi:MAG: alpha/beta hydrolase [Acidobacteriia bacterium]|nr:alpha/beta hydrolase [Terriglobia bacterium]MYK10349.1 alpha/beta hydrolase [Terriglobia bacterium]
MNQVAEAPPRLGQKPLIVLTKGRRRKGMEHVDDTQERHTELSENSDWRVISGAGHFIHHEDPAVVVDAIRSVVESARKAHANDATSE